MTTAVCGVFGRVPVKRHVSISLGLDGLLGLQAVLDIKSWCAEVEADRGEMDTHRLDSPPGGDEWAAWSFDPATGEEIPLYTRSEVDSFIGKPDQVKGDEVEE